MAYRCRRESPSTRPRPAQEKEDFDALMQRVEDLETENAALKTQLDAMESRLDAVDTTCEAGCEQAMRDLGFRAVPRKARRSPTSRRRELSPSPG